MTAMIDIGLGSLALAYLLLLVPLSIALVIRVAVVRDVITAALRMTVQLAFVGLYLQVVFDLDRWWLTTLWLVVMMLVADVSILQGGGLRVRRLLLPTLSALLLGTLFPLLVFVGLVLALPNLLEAQYFIPLAGMITGNCLRGSVIGMRDFHQAIRKDEKTYLLALAQGATLGEATRPYLRSAFQAALAPTLATMMTVGLVALPGMMTGILMTGESPDAAIKYQIAIMIAIFTGTAITVLCGILFARSRAFHASGVLDRRIFRAS